VADTADTRPQASPTLPKGRQYTWGTGRRKTSIARVRIAEGNGTIRSNKRELDDNFSEVQDRTAVTGPLDRRDLRTAYDVRVNVQGGGHTGQANAVSMGLARALLKVVPEKAHDLRVSGYLTRDSRMKERMKYGRRGARRSFQFSKR
jgi:small subunit ribosomal protein S9